MLSSQRRDRAPSPPQVLTNGEGLLGMVVRLRSLQELMAGRLGSSLHALLDEGAAIARMVEEDTHVVLEGIPADTTRCALAGVARTSCA